MRTCACCGQTKDESEFAKDRGRVRPTCRKCMNLKQLAYQKTEAGKLAGLKAKMKYRSGISLGIYEKLLKEQEGVCYLCKEAETLPGRGGEVARLAIDHDHSCCSGKRACGKCVRGLLCYNCNLYMAKVDKSSALMLRFQDYIHRRPLEQM